MLVEVVQEELGLGIPFELNDHPDAFPARFIPDLGYPLKLLPPCQLGNLLHESSFVGLVG